MSTSSILPSEGLEFTIPLSSSPRWTTSSTSSIGNNTDTDPLSRTDNRRSSFSSANTSARATRSANTQSGRRSRRRRRRRNTGGVRKSRNTSEATSQPAPSVYESKYRSYCSLIKSRRKVGRNLREIRNALFSELAGGKSTQRDVAELRRSFLTRRYGSPRGDGMKNTEIYRPATVRSEWDDDQWHEHLCVMRDESFKESEEHVDLVQDIATLVSEVDRKNRGRSEVTSSLASGVLSGTSLSSMAKRASSQVRRKRNKAKKARKSRRTSFSKGTDAVASTRFDDLSDA